MNILEINVIVITLYAIIFLYLLKEKKKIFFILTTINLVIINGLRDSSIGVDTIRYEKNFYTAATESIAELADRRSEFGYNFLSKIAVEIFGSFNIWLLIIAIFLFAAFGWFLYKYSKNVYISYLVFLALGFYGHTFNITRQLIAVMIVLFSYPHLLKRNFLKFSGIVLVASLFHTSALVFFPAYFICSIKLKRSYLYWMVPSFLLLYRYRLLLANYIMSVTRPEYLGRYDISGSIGGLALGIAMLLIVNFIFNSPFKNRSRENVVLTKLMMIGLFVQILSSYAYAFTRANLYYLIYLTLYIPYVLTEFPKVLANKIDKNKAHIITIINATAIIFLLAYYYIIIHSDGPGILPYKFFWQA